MSIIISFVLKYENLVLGELNTNCYLVWETDSKEAIVIDAADEGNIISEEIERRNLKLKMVLATHGHFDHNLAVLDLKLIYKIPFGCNGKDFFLLERQAETAKHFLGKNTVVAPNISKIDIDLDDSDEIKLGKYKVIVIKTPGHTPGGVSFLIEDMLFTGDTLFADGLRGDTKHNYSSTKAIFNSICRLLELPEETMVLPGHGEETTIGCAKKLFNCDYCELPDLA